MKNKNIVFMGTPDFSVPVLKMLIENTSVLLVVTQPDKIVGKNKNVSFSPVKELAIKENIPVFQPVRIRKDFEELKTLGLEDIELTDQCIVYASLKANTSSDTTIGFIAHMDTSPDLSGENVNPRIIKDYDGQDIVLNQELNIVLSPNEFPSLKGNLHHDSIVTDGTTLLGGDDKAGVAEIMTMLE